MILKSFPDLHWLKSKADLAFQSKEKRTSLFSGGWPNVVMNTSVKQAERPDIRGPLSLFTNISGESYASAGNKRVKVDDSCFFISNQDQHYSLEVNALKPVETFNIHFGKDFLQDVYSGHAHSSKLLLEGDALNPGQLDFYNILYSRNPTVDSLLFKLKGAESVLQEEELLAEVGFYLLHEYRDLKQRINKLPVAKKAVREEILRRISLATDMIHMAPGGDYSLDDLSHVSALSRFHFLRLFKSLYGCPPHQYIIRVRMQCAAKMLRARKLSIAEVALLSGYLEPASFTRIFQRTFKVTPSEFLLS